MAFKMCGEGGEVLWIPHICAEYNELQVRVMN